MAFKYPPNPRFEQLKKEAEERGYWLSDMKKIEQKVRERRLEWKRKFDDYIESMFYDDPTRPVDLIIATADKLADAREEHLDHKFDDGILEDD